MFVRVWDQRPLLEFLEEDVGHFFDRDFRQILPGKEFDDLFIFALDFVDSHVLQIGMGVAAVDDRQDAARGVGRGNLEKQIGQFLRIFQNIIGIFQGWRG